MPATTRLGDGHVRPRAFVVALLALTLLGSSLPRGPFEPVSRVPTSLAPRLTVLGASVQDRSQLADAVARFTDVGLALPDLQVEFHEHEAACDDHLGRFVASTTPWTIRICSELAFVATHELAHAWIDAHVTPARRRTLLATSGLRDWTGPDVAWGERGVERAAFVLQQVLMSEGGRWSPEWQLRHAQYEVLTGAPVPAPERWPRPR